jgi:hypothetical protein
MPAFAAWDVAAALGRLVVAFVEGIALRLRAGSRLVVAGVVGIGAAVRGARAVWHDARATVSQAAKEARRSVTAIRLRSHLHVRRLRRG